MRQAGEHEVGTGTRLAQRGRSPRTVLYSTNNSIMQWHCASNVYNRTRVHWCRRCRRLAAAALLLGQVITCPLRSPGGACALLRPRRGGPSGGRHRHSPGGSRGAGGGCVRVLGRWGLMSALAIVHRKPQTDNTETWTVTVALAPYLSMVSARTHISVISTRFRDAVNRLRRGAGLSVAIRPHTHRCASPPPATCSLGIV